MPVDNFILSDAQAFLNSMDTISLVVLAGFILFLLLILRKIGVSEFFTVMIGSLVVFGVPSFIAYYFFDLGFVIASSSDQDKVELTIMSYVVMALFVMTGFGTKSKAQKKEEEAAEKEKQVEEEALRQAEIQESAQKAAEDEEEKARKAAERADSLSDLSKRVASKEAEREAEREEEKARLEKEAEELRVYLQGLPEDIVKSFKREKICLDMPMKLVGKLHGRKYEEKRSVTKKVEKLTYKYEKNGTNLRGKPQYKLEVSYVDGRVDSFRDL